MENKVVYLSDGTEVYLKGKLDTGQSVVCEFVEYDTECGPEVEELAVRIVDNVYDTYNETPKHEYNKKRINELDEQIKTKQNELQELTQAVKEKSIDIAPKFKIGDVVWIVAWNEIRKETVSSIRITVTKDKIGYEYKSGSSETIDSPFLTEEEAKQELERRKKPMYYRQLLYSVGNHIDGFKKIKQSNIVISKEGNQFCALIGVNLQEGIAGFGDTEEEALNDLKKKCEEESNKL